MALSTVLMKEVCSCLKPGARIASMGYPDIIAEPEEVAKILGERMERLKFRADSEQVAKWHGLGHDVPDSHSFFELQGATLDVYDMAKHQGSEIVVDLNYPIQHVEEDDDISPYDIVLDIGTLEHCFNIGQAALNMAGLLKKGGIIFHENPSNGWGNHGFYNLQPTWYADFYGQKGFELLKLFVIGRGGQEFNEVPRTDRFQCQDEVTIIAIAQRTEVLPIEFVMQTKYRKVLAKAAKAAPAAGDKSGVERAA